jgi:hypothetical protein
MWLDRLQPKPANGHEPQDDVNRSREGGPSMLFRLPKPLHGWREFIHEIVIVVIGVLLALGGASSSRRFIRAQKSPAFGKTSTMS